MLGRAFALVMLLIVSVAMGCSKKQDPRAKQFGSAFNPQRRQLGIAPLPVDWKLKRSPANEIEWVNPSYSPSTACHMYKTLVFQGTQFVSGADSYLSGATFPSRDPDGGTEPESLTVTFQFPQVISGSGQWE